MKWLMIDSNNLMARSFFVMPPLEHNGQRTEAIYGFLRSLADLTEIFTGHTPVFCFDLGKPKRMLALPGYKASRIVSKKKAEGTPRCNSFLRDQCQRLRKEVLPRLGFRNVFTEPGYEADDMIASAVGQTDSEDLCVIVSSDKDFYQLLCEDKVSIWCPHRKLELTEGGFRDKWGIHPTDWARLKAMVGCVSDDIPGIPGVGEVTAAKYIRKELKENSSGYKKIMHGIPIMTKNLPLVSLPYKGCPDVDLINKSNTSEMRWASVCKDLGFKPSRMGRLHA